MQKLADGETVDLDTALEVIEKVDLQKKLDQIPGELAILLLRR